MADDLALPPTRRFFECSICSEQFVKVTDKTPHRCPYCFNTDCIQFAFEPIEQLMFIRATVEMQ